MILIFCETKNISSKQVLEYLRYENQEFETFTENDLIEFTYGINNLSYSYKVYKNDNFVCLDTQIKSVWYIGIVEWIFELKKLTIGYGIK